MDLNNVEIFESSLLNRIKIPEINEEGLILSLMNEKERSFINGIIRKIRPKKILEVGVASGYNSSLILNSISDLEDSELYSIDILEKWWLDENKKIGYLVEENYPELMNKWHLYIGGVSFKFLESIGGDIDLCILDTAHILPGEIIDFITIFPFLKKGAILILHDIQLHISSKYNYSTVCCLLFSAIKGKKYYLNSGIEERGFSNIGAIILEDDIKEYINDLLMLLTINWQYMIDEESNNYIKKVIKKYYDEDIYHKYEIIYNINKSSKSFIDINDHINLLKNRLKMIENENIILNNKIDKIINIFAWWIPVKKWRESFRNKFKTIADQ